MWNTDIDVNIEVAWWLKVSQPGTRTLMFRTAGVPGSVLAPPGFSAVLPLLAVGRGYWTERLVPPYEDEKHIGPAGFFRAR